MSAYVGSKDIVDYRHKGYWISPVLFNAQEVAAIRHAIQQVYRGELDAGKSWPFVEPVGTETPGAIKTALFSWTVNSDIADTVQDTRLTSIARALLDTDSVRIWQDQAIWKPGAGDAASMDGNIGFHQDYSYWQDSSTTNMISANIALQDVSAENGCLRVFEASHTYGLAEELGDFFNTDIQDLRTKYKNVLPDSRERMLEMKAGQVSFHHSLLVHGSGPNTTDEPRFVLAPAYTPADTYYRSEGQAPCPHSDLMEQEKAHGQLFDGKYFPVV